MEFFGQYFREFGIGYRVRRCHVIGANCWVVFDDDSRGRKVLLRGRELGPIVVRNNRLVGLTGIGIEGASEAGNRWFETRQKAGLLAYDGSLASLPKPGTAD